MFGYPDKEDDNHHIFIIENQLKGGFKNKYIKETITNVKTKKLTNKVLNEI